MAVLRLLPINPGGKPELGGDGAIKYHDLNGKIKLLYIIFPLFVKGEGNLPAFTLAISLAVARGQGRCPQKASAG